MSNNIDEIWDNCLLAFKNNNKIPNNVYQSFFESTSLHDLDQTTAYILVSNSLQKEFLSLPENNQIIQETLDEITETNYKITIITDADIKNKTIEDVQPIVHVESNLIPEMTFENFVVGESNKRPYEASIAVSAAPGSLFNPLFIYGKPGLGKTHLVHSIGNEIKLTKPNMRVLYVSSETFFNDYLNVAVNKTMSNDEFNKKYREIDTLIVDDVQFLANKPGANEQFFHVYNELFNLNKQIVLTSDVEPRQLDGLADRLVSRFSEGLPVCIEPPEIATRIEILKLKLKEFGDSQLILDDDALYYIARNYSKDVRDLKRALNELMLYAINNEIPSNIINLEIIKQAFPNYKKSSSNNENITPEAILEIVCKYYNLSKKQLLSKNRQKKLTIARQIAIYLTRTLLNTPYQKIGSIYNRDHSTIITSYHKINDMMNENEGEYVLVVNELKELLKTN